MKKLWMALIASVTLVLGAAVPAGAITDGELDGDGHPYVGLMVAQTEDGTPLWRCSGTLISPTVYVTAGHCTDGAERAAVWFDSNVEDGTPGTSYPFTGEVSGTAHTYPLYNDAAFYLYDLGLVVLDKPVILAEYGQLPDLKELDALKPRRSSTFTSVGYGLQKAFPDAASWKDQADKIRYVAHPHLLQINTGFTGPRSIMLSNNANTGGTCFGDSGGPNFIGDSNVIAGVTSFGMNSTCAGTGGVYRIDGADELEWINSFM